MKRIVKKERPMFKLTSATWSCSDIEEAALEIFAGDLKAAEVGSVFTPDLQGTSYQNNDLESLLVSSKSEDGKVISCIFKREKYRASLEEEEGELVIFEQDPVIEVKRVVFELH